MLKDDKRGRQVPYPTPKPVPPEGWRSCYKTGNQTTCELLSTTALPSLLQVVEVEQVARWTLGLLRGTCLVKLLVTQNRKNHTVRACGCVWGWRLGKEVALGLDEDGEAEGGF